MDSSIELARLFDDFQWEDIPAIVTSAENLSFSTEQEDWHLPYTMRVNATLRFSLIKSAYAKKSLQLYCLDRARTVSCHSALMTFEECWSSILKGRELTDGEQFKDALISCFESAINKAKRDKRLWVMYRPIRWYVWCAEYYPELGFCAAYALELDSMRIPGNPKGEAVRNEDPTRGPLNRALELQLLINALAAPCTNELRALQERAAAALFIAHGRNPANLSLLLEGDLVNLTPEVESPTWVIRYPRIKKRLKDPRSELVDVPINAVYAGYVLELIAYNQRISCEITISGELIKTERPLFINELLNNSALRSARFENIFNYPASYVSGLLQSFVRRHRVVSPLTGGSLIVSARRLRYTLATNMVLDGYSRREIACLLDHSDLQHVEVYFDLAGGIVEHLDRAYFGYYSLLAKYFKGKVVSRNDDIINADDNSKLIPCIDVLEDIGVCGLDALCQLYPPYSCYKCPKFQAYMDADHESVFEFLYQRRESALAAGNSRLAVQLDEIMYAVQQVIRECKSRIPEVEA
ncbi:TPA: site-specific integrase [Pseudomonas aeruginosa]|nr:site-specific integrase [Pseudomonas aeruginosa]HEP8928436.1 site-specific integrase [Pseudomonas aeruginosa]